MRRIHPLTSIGATLVLFLVAACAPTTSPTGGAGGTAAGGGAQAPSAPQRTLVIALRGEPPTLAIKPLVAFTAALRPPMSFFNASLDAQDEREVPYPYLAEALPQLNSDTWQVSADGSMETRYRLRPNLTWHDGTPLSAEDFAFAWRVYATPAFGQSTSPPIGIMSEVVAPDAQTVVIRWRQPFADAGSMNMDFQALPRHLLEEQFRDLDPVAFTNLPFWSSDYLGLGPYKMERWEPGSFIEGRAFEGHALGKPKIDRLKIMFIPDPNTALANLLTGEVAYVGEYVFADDHAATLEREWSTPQRGVVLYAPTALRVSVVQQRPEVASPPSLLDLRVRRAIAHAIDGETANEVLNSGKGIVTPSMTSPRVDFYPEVERVLTKYPFDVRRSQVLMEEAGYTRGADGFFVGRDGAVFQTGIWSSSGAKNEQENAVIADGLRKVGFDASRHVFSAAQLADAQARALIPGLSTRGQTSRPLRDYTTEQVPRAENRWRGENRGGWLSPAYDRVHDAYTRALDRNERVRSAVELNRLMSEEVPAITHWFNPSVTAHLGNLRGPVARQTPDSPVEIIRPHLWEWTS